MPTHIIDDVTDRFVINVNESDSETESYSDSDTSK